MKEEIKRVKELGDKIGYGHLMCIASALWRKDLEDNDYPTIGAFVPVCLPFVEKKLAKATKGEREMYDEMVRK